ncbi:hypothetical protein Tco_1177101, partial [Tanacetum coccineum]
SVMSDSDESGVTYTEISSTFEVLSDIGSPGVVPSPNYIPGPEEPQSPPPLEPIYPEYMPQEDEVFSAEEQPLPAAALPTAQSPDYVPESDPEADPKEDDDEDPEEDHVDYAADGGDDGDDEDESSKDDEDDIEADDDKEEEEHPAPADSVVVALPAADQAPSAISILAPVPTPVWSDAKVARLLAISTPPSSPLSPWSSPLPHIPFPPLPPIPSPSLLVSPPLPVSSPVPGASTFHSLLLPPPIILSHTRPAAPSSGTPPLHLLFTDRREDRPEVTLPPRKRLGREIRRDPERDVGYGITDSWDEIVETLQGAPVSTDTELGRHMTAFETWVRQDTDKIYTRLDNEQSG